MRWRIDGCIGRLSTLSGLTHCGSDDSLLGHSSPPTGRAVKTTENTWRTSSLGAQAHHPVDRGRVACLPGAAAADDPLYLAFVLLVLYGLRRGEVLALRWQDLDREDGEIRIRQHIQRVHGQLLIGPVKTAAGRRDLPLLDMAADVLELRRAAQAADRAELGRAWQDSGPVFTTRTGLPVEPRNLARSFRRICENNGLRVISVHHVRHTTATLLKNLQVPARDAQLILGHSRLSVTLEIYTHEDRQGQREALGRIGDALRAHDTPEAT
jgi:integrase